MPTDGVLDTRQFDDEVVHAYLTGSLAAIREVIRGLRGLPGRKSLILFTEDMLFTYRFSSLEWNLPGCSGV